MKKLFTRFYFSLKKELSSFVSCIERVVKEFYNSFCTFISELKTEIDEIIEAIKK